MSTEGRIGKFAADKPPRMSGKDAPQFLIRTDSHQTLYLADVDGQAAAISVQSIPAVEQLEDGVQFHKLVPLHSAKLPVALFAKPMVNEADLCVVTVTKQGLIKKTLASELKGPSSDLFTLVKVNEGDELVEVQLVKDNSHYLIVTKKGMAIRFEGSEVRVMGMIAAGVNVIKLASGDEVAGMVELTGKGEVVLVASNGTGWRIDPDGFPVQGRYGQGVIGCRLDPGIELIGVVFGKKNHQYTLQFKKAAAKTCRIDEIEITRRATKGETLVKLTAGDRITTIKKVTDFGD
jgi:DNA gyrase subunit A